MGRKRIITDSVTKNFICNSYMNGMRIKDIILILKRDFELDFSDRTLYRFLTKNCPSRWAITHPNGKNKVED